jgi:hypothetical protein
MAEREHRGLVFTPLMVTDMERRTHAEALTGCAMARGEHTTRARDSHFGDFNARGFIPLHSVLLRQPFVPNKNHV